MKSFLLTFLLAAIVLFVAVESRRGFKRGGEKGKKTADCGRPWLKRRCVKGKPNFGSSFIQDKHRNVWGPYNLSLFRTHT